MKPSLYRALFLAGVASFGGSCVRPAPHAVVTVADPDGVATTAVSLDIIIPNKDPRRVDLDGKRFPLTMTITGPKAGRRKLIQIDALDADGVAVGRGVAWASFPPRKSGTATITLGAVCGAAVTLGQACALADGSGRGVCSRGECVRPSCGDGILQTETGEECDDGNSSGEDNCTPDCLLNVCGDRYVNLGVEDCDDGNLDDTDSCTSTCENNRCGDGRTFAGEEACDDGNVFDDDACTTYCTVAACGDGIVRTDLSPDDDGYESCDDGSLDDPLRPSLANPNDGCFDCVAPAWTAQVLIGSDWSDVGDGGLAQPDRLALATPSGLAWSGTSLAISDAGTGQVFAYDTARGGVSLLAGSTTPSGLGDGAAGPRVNLDGVAGVGADLLGNVFVAEAGNNVVRLIERSSLLIQTHTGRPSGGRLEPGLTTAPRTDMLMTGPAALAVAADGSVWVADTGNHVVVRVDPLSDEAQIMGGPALVSTYDPGPEEATAGCRNDDHSTAIRGYLCYPRGLAFDANGDLLIADSGNHQIRKIVLAGSSPALDTLAGDGTAGDPAGSVDISGARFNRPFDLAVAQDGTIYVADYGNHKIRMISGSTMTTLAGTGTPGFSGDGGPASAAELSLPTAVELGEPGALYVADSGNGRIRRIDLASGTIETVLGGVDLSSVDASSALTLPLGEAAGVDLDPAGRLLLSDSDNHRVFRVESDGSVTTVAGSGDIGIRDSDFGGDGGPASSALLDSPRGIDVGSSGEIYVADTGNHRIRRVDAAGTITTIAGSGSSAAGGYSGNGGAASLARLNGPRDVLVTGQGTYLIADSDNCVVREVASGTIDAFAGSGTCATGSVAGPPLTRNLGIVVGLAHDTSGTVWVADRGVDELDPADDVIWSVPATGDMQPELMPGAVVGMLHVDSSDNVLFTTGDGDPETDDERVWQYTPVSGAVLLGGGGTAGRGDGLAATAASFVTPAGLTTDTAGNVLVADGERVRWIDAASSIVSTVAGRLHPDGPLPSASLVSPAALVTGPVTDVWWVADGGRIREVDLANSQVNTVAGYPDGLEHADNSTADARLARLLGGVSGIVYDTARQVIYITEPERHVLSIVDMASAPAWTIATYAGTEGVNGYESDGSKWEAPTGLALDGDVLYAADAGNHVVMRIDLTDETVSLLAGEPRIGGDAPDGGSALGGRLNAPSALAVGADGSLYVADTGNHKVRRIDTTGSMTTVLGTGERGSSDSALPAREQLVDSPAGLAIDGYGNLFVTSAGAVRIVAAGDDTVATGDDHVHTVYGAPPAGEYPATATFCLTGLALESGDDSVLVLDECQGMLVRLQRDLTQ